MWFVGFSKKDKKVGIMLKHNVWHTQQMIKLTLKINFIIESIYQAFHFINLAHMNFSLKSSQNISFDWWEITTCDLELKLSFAQLTKFPNCNILGDNLINNNTTQMKLQCIGI